MDLSRRDFFKLSAGSFTGSAVGSRAGLGASLTDSGPLVLGRVRHAGPCGRREDRQHRGRSAEPHNEGALCPKGAAICQLHVEHRDH
jgi:anaerobic selenocysteine-containing dehydrogenase